jgi:pyridoxal 5'-phosphate synthase pdxT subunit
MSASTLRVGVLELHGDFAEHTAMLYRCGVKDTVPVRQLEHLNLNLDALVLPGGESTVMGKLLTELGMLAKVQSLAASGLPMFGTCAGCILLARDLPQYPDQPRVGAMSISVDRNVYGRQIDSFQTNVDARSGVFADGRPLSVVHIRAPGIMQVDDDVEILAEHDGRPILVRQGGLLGCVSCLN